jgi:hypothetical protein
MVFEDTLASRALQNRHRICLDCDGLAEFRVNEFLLNRPNRTR